MRNSPSKGFTLIEIIIVIVVIGVLATLALPRITGQIEASRAAEAMNMFGTIRRAAINCVDTRSAAAGGEAAVANNCITWGSLEMTPPADPLFTYASGAAAGVMRFRAIRGTNSICMNITALTGATTYSLNPDTAANPYRGMVNRTGAYLAGICTANGPM
mgnify:CR=1 FL=1